MPASRPEGAGFCRDQFLSPLTYAPLSSVQAFPMGSMPSADFCPVLERLTPPPVTKDSKGRAPEVSSTASAHNRRLRAFATRFFQTSPRNPAFALRCHLHQVVKRTCTSKLSIMLGTHGKSRDEIAAFRLRDSFIRY